ncbi:RelA/SpoT domain-containing protein [Agrobacterium vitis]|uniref:RelA/SpoT domain-containing protein n=1 Tax=Agrobacterium vitis TaxID=373 RepID=UPI0018D217D0|nr:RelA/SpoT domain-containing protein [Agrobacterium vitis]
MAWPAPTDSKSSVKKAGDRIRKGQETSSDIDILNKWRAAHGYIINTFQANLRTRTRQEHVPVAQRLKRGATIVDKLRQGRALDLSTMQDIAGVRMVFHDVVAMQNFRTRFHETKAKHELVNEKERYDYMLHPKSSGYRGIHDVYKYKAQTISGAAWNGLQIEIQYRTLVQHAWATAVELSDALTANRTKFSQGSADNTRFFQICSELLARSHESANSCLPEQTREALVKEWHEIEDRAHIFRQLKGLGGQGGTSDLSGFVLLIMKEDNTLEVEKQRSYKNAVMRLIQLEDNYPKWDIVLVSGDKSDSLKTVFRNYFQNATEFTRMIDEALVQD